jgi:hypothetical protein
MSTFTIKSINQVTGAVVVIYDVDNLEQTLNGLPVTDKDELLQALSDYGQAYSDGTSAAVATVPSEVASLVNKPVVFDQK